MKTFISNFMYILLFRLFFSLKLFLYELYFFFFCTQLNPPSNIMNMIMGPLQRLDNEAYKFNQRRCGIIVNESTTHLRPKDTHEKSNQSHNALQQWPNWYLNLAIKIYKKTKGETIQTRKLTTRFMLKQYKKCN